MEVGAIVEWGRFFATLFYLNFWNEFLVSENGKHHEEENVIKLRNEQTRLCKPSSTFTIIFHLSDGMRDQVGEPVT